MRTQVGGSPVIPSGAVGVGAVWENVFGSTRYELVDVSDGIATIIGTSDFGDSTTWVNFEEPLLSAYDGWIDVSGRGITQINHTVVNKAPCCEVAMVATEHPFGGFRSDRLRNRFLSGASAGLATPLLSGTA